MIHVCRMLCIDKYGVLLQKLQAGNCEDRGAYPVYSTRGVGRCTAVWYVHVLLRVTYCKDRRGHTCCQQVVHIRHCVQGARVLLCGVPQYGTNCEEQFNQNIEHNSQ